MVGILAVSSVLNDISQENFGFNVHSTQQGFPDSTLLNVQLWNIGSPGEWSSGQLNSFTGVFITPVRGYYHVSATVVFAENVVGIRTAQINIGNTVAFRTETESVAGNTTSLHLPGGLILLQPRDLVTLKASQNSGGGLDVEGPTTTWSMLLHEEA